MKEMINIAELLKNCPEGMELDCTMYDNVTLRGVDKIDFLTYPIQILIGDKGTAELTKYGEYTESAFAKCVIFPKGKTTWEGFQRPFKDGDILTCKSGSVFIYKGPMYNNQCDFYCGYRISDGAFVRKLFKDKHFGYLSECRFATEEEKEKLFKVIKDNGYKWNVETNTLEKLIEPKFKIGDRIRHIKSLETFTVIHVFYMDGEFRAYEIQIEKGRTKSLFARNQDDYELVPVAVIPKFKVGDTIRHKTDKWSANRTIKHYDKNIGYFTTINDWVRIEDQDNYELVPNKFNINILKPFDTVLVRYNKDNKWCCSFFSHIDKEHHSHCYKYVTTSSKSYPYCIPYKDNEHLRGTTNDCSDFYKTWE